MSGDVIPFPRRLSAEEAHDRYMAAAEAFRANPTKGAAWRCAEAYRRFYVAFNEGSSVGLDRYMDELWRNMDRTLKEARAG